MGQVLRFGDPTEIGRRWRVQHEQGGYQTVRAGAKAVGLSKSLYWRLLKGQVVAVSRENFLTIALTLGLAARRGAMVVPKFFRCAQLVEARPLPDSALRSSHDLEFWEPLWADKRYRPLIDRFTRDVLFSGYSEERLFAALDGVRGRLQAGGEEGHGPAELTRAGRLGAYLSRAFANERALLRIRRAIDAGEQRLGEAFAALEKLVSENASSPLDPA